MTKPQQIQMSFNIENDYIKTLKEQLNEKDSQIKELTIALGKAQGLDQNTKVLLSHEQEQPLLLEQHIKELDDKFIIVRENMQQQKGQHECKEKKNWFNKILRK